MFLKSTRKKVIVSTNGKPLYNRVTYTDMRSLHIDENGKKCVIINNEVIYDERMGREENWDE